MNTEITSPALLTLGCAQVDGQLCELGITLQHPPIQLTARPAQSLLISGARAHLAHQYATALGLAGELEIELAIPANMGLGSDQMLRACIERLSSLWRGTPLHQRPTLAEHAFHQGGLVLTNDDGRVQDRAEMAHSAEEDDWVFVLALPQEPDSLPETFEIEQRARLRQAAPDLNEPIAALFSAVRRDDFATFADALTDVHSANEAALASGGHPIEPCKQDRDILECMHANGAAMAARALTGLGLYGLIQGGPASRALRKALVARLGYFGPLVMASICDNQGARIKFAQS